MTSTDGAAAQSGAAREEWADHRRRAWTDVALLALGKFAVGFYVLHLGFSHVSDDDYARTVISQQFAHAPKLDPSATSWLPAPFWITGAAMAIAGRSLAVSRAVSTALGALGVAAPYAALRAIGVERGAALAAVAAAMLLPWNAWLGVAMVPEGWTGALVAAALIAMTHPPSRPWAAGALLLTSLSRYEAWPACIVFAVLCIVEARSSRDRDVRARETTWALVAVAGPLAWMGWNAFAHGSAIHFLARVRAFRQATGAAEIPLSDKLLGYPRALLDDTPEVAALAALGALALLVDRRVRRRWGWSAAGVIAIVAFLIVGDVRDGAPTHHPARALSPIWWVILGLSADSIALMLRSATMQRLAGARLRIAATAALTVGALAWAASLPSRWQASPGRTDWERRDAQLATGRAMQMRDVAWAEITPCAYEHFALLAAWGRPERAHINPPLHRPPSADCPHVIEH